MSNFNDVTGAFSGWLQTLIGERTTGSYVNGRWVDNAPTPISFKGVVQNLNAEDLKVLEEGNRTEIAIKIHTQFELIPQEGATTTGDKINYRNNVYLVYNVAPRYIGGYFKVLALRIA
jgi:hypothetical protein